MTGVLDFMERALVTWVQTFDIGEESPRDFSELSEGLFLYDVFMQISNQDICNGLDDMKRKCTDGNARLHNWSTLLTAVVDYYEDVLQQIIVTDLPDITAIATEPTKDESISSLEKMLLLLLGCAVQCADRVRFISAIKELDISVQEVLVGHIQQVTDNPSVVLCLPQKSVMLSEEVLSSLHHITHTLTAERNSLHQRVSTLSQECMYLRAELNGHQGLVSPPESLEGYHVSQDLVVARNKINTLTHDLEERNKLLCEVQEELQQSNAQYTSTKEQNLQLKHDIKLAGVYREQAEEYREKASRVDDLERDVARQKDLLNEMEFYKVRIQELREDNDLLIEAQGRSEEQASSAHKRSEALMDELVKVQMQLESAVSEQEQMSFKLKVMEEQKSMLEQQQEDQLSSSGSRGLSRIRSFASSEFLTSSMLQLPVTSTPGPCTAPTVSDELKESMTEKVGELEAENEELRSKARQTAIHLTKVEEELAELRAKSEHEMQQKVSEIELQTKELRKKASRELTREFEARVTEIEQRSLNLKQRVTDEFKQRLNHLETSNKSLQKRADDSERKVEAADRQCLEAQAQLKLTRESWSVIKEQAARLDGLNRELLLEREEFKQRITHTKEESQGRVRHLEKQVDMLQFRTSQLEAQNARLSQTMVETQGELGHYISVVDGADRQEKRSNGPARIVYIPPSSSPAKASVHAELMRSSSSCSSGDGRCLHGEPHLVRGHRSGHSSTRPASVIGLTDQRSSHDPLVVYRSPSSSTPSSSHHRVSHQMLAKPHHSHRPLPHRPRSASLSDHHHPPPVHCPRHCTLTHSPRTPQFVRNDRSRRTMPSKMSPHSREQHSSTSSVASVPESRALREVNGRGTPPPAFTRSQSFREHGARSYKEACHGFTHHRGNSTQSLSSHPESPQAFRDPYLVKSKSEYPPSNNENIMNGLQHHRDSDQDSGCDRSPNGGISLDDTRGSSRCSSPRLPQNQDYHIVASKTIIQQTQIRATSQPQYSEKWRLLVDKVVELQDKNQMLTMENTEMQRSVKSLNHCGERITSLENQNLQLELENRKLKRICESLQYSLTGKNPYDKRTYHFYTNV